MQDTIEKPPAKVPETGSHETVSAELDPKSARKEAINDMKRAHIMDAALKVIARDGFLNARLEDIAEEAGFSKASIYHYFPDKEALVMHIVIREQRATYDECVKIMERGLPFIETLREFGHNFYNTFFQYNKFYGGAQNNVGASVPSMMSSFVVSMTKHHDLMSASIMCKRDTDNLIMRIISKAREDGVLTVPVSDRTVCYFIQSFLQSFIMECMSGKQTDEAGLPKLCEPPTKEDFNKAMDSMFVFISPWIKEGNHA